MKSLFYMGHAGLGLLGSALVSEKFALGLEGTLQRIERSEFRFPSLGSAITFDF